ncbi:hypothetical protein GCM10007359_04530 [Rothia aerolata]|uniref:Uncharacterized protein n=1 Tax=Rothia aerolata TaxID=1812262 RepID=A0A917INX0_9MICC|nr:hypothetical protein GCM10007359_04530 [Rothia aerolata]
MTIEPPHNGLKIVFFSGHAHYEVCLFLIRDVAQQPLAVQAQEDDSAVIGGAFVAVKKRVVMDQILHQDGGFREDAVEEGYATVGGDRTRQGAFEKVLTSWSS